MNAYVQEYQKIERRARRRDNFLLRYLPIVLALSGVVIIGKIYLQSIAIDWSRQVMDQKEVAHDLRLENEELRRTIAGLTTRDRLARDAGLRLQMVASTEEDIVWLPVADRPAGTTADRGRSNGEAVGAVATLRSWIDMLWQEEALALTRP